MNTHAKTKWNKSTGVIFDTDNKTNRIDPKSNWRGALVRRQLVVTAPTRDVGFSVRRIAPLLRSRLLLSGRLPPPQRGRRDDGDEE
jgi:hypothetical protein